jgi:hypothetical protein
VCPDTTHLPLQPQGQETAAGIRRRELAQKGEPVTDKAREAAVSTMHDEKEETLHPLVPRPKRKDSEPSRRYQQDVADNAVHDKVAL